MGEVDVKTETDKTKTPEEIEALLYSGVHSLSLFSDCSDLKTFVSQVERTSLTKEARHLNRALRYTFIKLRRRLTSSLLVKAVKEFYPAGEGRRLILEALGQVSAVQISS